ncbi:MAG: sigma-70 family RNA polymerase sigma factor [Clostridiales bacterium]|nr:sigma-70 family RNA polymerase sigma factor [Clostridiales bacterium]
MSLSADQAKSFEAAVAPFERQVFFTCLGMMGNSQDAQDCAQETMLKAYRSYGKFRGESKLSTWLYTIASRCCLDALNKNKEIVSLEALREKGWEKEDPAPSPYLQLEESERKHSLRRAISLLNSEQQQVIVLCDLQGLSYAEAAEIIDCPVGTVKSRLNRARIALKDILTAKTELFSANESLIDERRETL